MNLLIANQNAQEAYNKAQDDKMQRLMDFLMNQGQRYQPTDEEHSNTYASLVVLRRPRPMHLKREDSQVPTTQTAGERALHRNQSSVDDDSTNFAMPLKHTTAVHNLFEWRSIMTLLPENQSTSYSWISRFPEAYFVSMVAEKANTKGVFIMERNSL